MDARHFDALTRMLTTPNPRRRLLGLLATLPLLGWLAPEDSAAKDRRRRRKKRQKQRRRKAKGKRQRQRNKRACKPRSKATVCAGQCGEIKSRQTCGKTFDCGACACDPACAACHTCQAGPNTPGTCVPDPDQIGDPCGSPGQVCAADGSCACTSTSCAACEECGGDGICSGCRGCCDGATCVTECPACTICDAQQCLPCPGCCDGNGVCQAGDTNAACGMDNATCERCTTPETCGGGGEAGECGCTPTTCASEGKDCGQIPDGCGLTLDCGTCSGNTPICTNNVCTACSTNQQCGSGSVCCEGACFSGICCGDTDCDDPTAPDCRQHDCTCASNGNAPCADGTACCARGCLDTSTDPDNCGACGHVCPENNLCVAGVCTPCTVTCLPNYVCDSADLQTALNNGGTVVVCPGLYTGSVTVANIASVTMIGAGEKGSNSVTSTVLRRLDVDNVTSFTMSHVQVRGYAASGDCGGSNGMYIKDSGATLTDCTITDIGPKFCDAVSTFQDSTVEMVRCLVTGSYMYGSGGLAIEGGKLTVRGSRIHKNYTLDGGGGLHVRDGAVVKLLGGTTVTENRADGEGGGIYVSNAAVELDDSIISGNYTRLGGDADRSGGIYADTGGIVTISADSSVTGNIAENPNPPYNTKPDNCAGPGTINGTCGP